MIDKFQRAMWVLLIVVCMSCASSNPQGEYTDPKSDAPTAKSSDETSIYYDFGDVLLPVELDIDRDNSFVFRAPGFSAGVISLKGRLTMDSLVQFFDTNMAKDNWRQISAFKSPRTMMLFHKENRWCVISMDAGGFSTLVEIWVTPASGVSAAEQP